MTYQHSARIHKIYRYVVSSPAEATNMLTARLRSGAAELVDQPDSAMLFMGDVR